MSAPADLFPGFERRFIEAQGLRLFVRIGGSGPPLLLLHGFPQTHAEWHRIAPKLAERFTVVAPDLRGYGDSDAPASQGGALYSKRVMAEDAASLMRALGFPRFRLAGHDRGGRVAYRLAFDHPRAVEALAVLDIAPTLEMWEGMDAARALQVYHWSFLAQPAPMPERLLERDPRAWIDHTLASWTATKSLACFDDRALARYRTFFAEPARIHACCEDYRAGATLDRTADAEDRAAGRRIGPPVLALWGGAGIPAQGASPLDVWRRWADDVRGRAIEAGHFLPEENPDATADALLCFF